MSIKKLSVSMAAYVVISMIIAVVWHMVIFHEEYRKMGAFTREEPIMAFGMLAMVFQGFVFGYFYPIFLKHTGGSTLKGAVKYSLILGINIWTVMVFATAAKFNIEPVAKFVAMGTIFQVLQFVAVGCGLHFIHREKV